MATHCILMNPRVGSFVSRSEPNREDVHMFHLRPYGALAPLALLLGLSCGGSGRATAVCTGDCTCSGETCACRIGGTCSFGSSPVGPGAGSGTGGMTAASESPPGPQNDVTYHCDSKSQCDLTCGTGCTN